MSKTQSFFQFIILQFVLQHFFKSHLKEKEKEKEEKQTRAEVTSPISPELINSTTRQIEGKNLGLKRVVN